jgi:hypothetical protein
LREIKSSIDLIQVGVIQEESSRLTSLYGWVKDSDSTDTSTINAEEVEQLDSLLNAQDDLKKNIRVNTAQFTPLK